MEGLELLDTAQQRAQAIVDQVTPEDRERPCPCDGWDVAKLLDKMVTSGHLFATLCRGEKPGPELNLLFPTDIAGDDPSAAFAEACRDALDAFAESELEGEMMGPLGVMVPRRAGLMVRTMDVSLNTWDLARAIGVDSGLTDEQATAIMAFTDGFFPKVRQKDDHVRFAEPTAVPADADPVDRLVASSGRDPDWTRPRRDA